MESFSIDTPSLNPSTATAIPDLSRGARQRGPRFCAPYDFAVSKQEADGLAESIRGMAAFSRYGARFKRLKGRYRLAVLSNIDDDLFAFTAAKLGVEMDFVVTAQQVQSYKPSLRNFETAIAAPAGGKEPAVACGGELVPRCGTCPHARDRNRVGEPAAGPSIGCRPNWWSAKPDIEVPTMGALAETMLGDQSEERMLR